MSILLAWNTYLVGGLTVLFLVVCVMMVLTVLIQRPQGGGLSGAFGSGAGSGQTAFGAKTGDALTIFTIIVFILFLGFGITLNFGYRPEAAGGGDVRVLKTQVTPPTGKGDPNAPDQTPGDAGATPAPTPAGQNPAGTSPTGAAPLVVPPAPAPAPATDPKATPATAPAATPVTPPAAPK